MLCGGNTVIMCGTCDMGRKKFSVGPSFFGTPPPWGGVTPEKKYPTRYQNFFSSPPPCAGASSTPFGHHIITMAVSSHHNLTGL